MRRISVGVAVAVSGVLIAWAAQSIWRDSPDPLWASVAVIAVLSAVTHRAASDHISATGAMHGCGTEW
jgi:hypothetical protein